MLSSDHSAEVDVQVQDLLNQGLAFSRADDAPAAVEAFSMAAKLAPAYAVPYFLLACEKASLGEVEQAESAFAQTLLLDSQFHMARFQMGLLQFTSGRPAMAALTWQSLLDLPEGEPLPDFVRGFALLAQDQFAESVGAFESGILKNTSNAPLNGDIARVVAQIKGVLVPEQAEDQNAHFLLASYQRQGSYRQ